MRKHRSKSDDFGTNGKIIKTVRKCTLMCMPNFPIYETAQLNYKWKFHYNTKFAIQSVRYYNVLHHDGILLQKYKR